MRFRFGDHTLDTSTLQLLAGTSEIDLEPQVFAVLSHLITNRDRVVSKEELLDEVWGSRFVSESALTTRIKQARQAVGDTGRDQQVIRTFHGRGYRFMAPVKEMDGRPAASAGPRRAGTPDASPVRAPHTRFAEGEGASIAFQTFGEGPDLVLIAGYATNVETQWELPSAAEFLTRLSRFARVTVLDKRGVGLSDRVAHDSVPPLETRADDLSAVLDAAKVERATVLGSSEGGSLSAVFAASHPERVERLVLHNTWVTSPARDAEVLDFVLKHWGKGWVYAQLAPSLAPDRAGRERLARYERQSATPRAARLLTELIGQTCIGGIVGAITVPTLVLHRVGDEIVPLDHGRELAASIPGACLVELDGDDHYLFAGDPSQTLTCIEEFITGTRSGDDLGDRVLATVLFVDLVVSTRQDQALGNRRWTDRLDRFHAVAEAEVERQRGRVVNTTGDGVLATFDGPGRAVRSAGALRDAVQALGLTVRAGVHTAEVQCRGSDIAGIGVHLAGRVAGAAHPGEVWVTRTVTDLVAGTGLSFEPRGDHVLKGIDQPWQLFVASL